MRAMTSRGIPRSVVTFYAGTNAAEDGSVVLVVPADKLSDTLEVAASSPVVKGLLVQPGQ